MQGVVQISILCEDQAQMGFRDKIFLAQHGFSAFVEAGAKILFDAGATDVFLHNAGLLGIDPAAASPNPAFSLFVAEPQPPRA